MNRNFIPRKVTRLIDRETFAQNFLAAIEPLPTPELHRFLTECRRDNRGTEAEHLMIELIEGQIALREIHHKE